MASEAPQRWLPPVGATPVAAPSSPAAPPAPPPEEEPADRSLFRRIAGALVAAVLIFAKFGKFVLLGLSKVKIFTTSASMLVSVAAYSLIWGWKFALGFVLLMLVHEMGHVIQLRREGIEASAPLFIPFLGAVVGAKSLGGNALAEARVGLAGPVLGSLGAAALVPVAITTGEPFWYALAFTGFFLNLFNLLPVVPLDGGRAMAAMAPWMWFLGFGALVFFAIQFPNPIILLIVLFGGMELYRRWKLRKTPESQAYYQVAPKHRVAVAAVYLGLIALLVVGMDAMFIERSLSDV